MPHLDNPRSNFLSRAPAAYQKDPGSVCLEASGRDQTGKLRERLPIGAIEIRLTVRRLSEKQLMDWPWCGAQSLLLCVCLTPLIKKSTAMALDRTGHWFAFADVGEF